MDVERLIPGLPAIYVKLVDKLEATLATGDITRSREEIRSRMGTMPVEADEREIRFYSQQNHAAASLLRAAGSNAIKFVSGGAIYAVPTLPVEVCVEPAKTGT